MKRFEIDWPKIENALAHRNILDQRLGEVLERVKNGKAYETAQDGILRIQRTYNIEPQDSNAIFTLGHGSSTVFRQRLTHFIKIPNFWSKSFWSNSDILSIRHN